MGKRRDGRRQNGARRYALDAALGGHRRHGAAADIEGYEVCGKTSTAEIASEEGGYKKEVYNIGFCGFIDNSSSNLVCFVGANEVYAMRQTTQIFNDIMENAVKQYNITSMPSN